MKREKEELSFSKLLRAFILLTALYGSCRVLDSCTRISETSSMIQTTTYEEQKSSTTDVIMEKGEHILMVPWDEFKPNIRQQLPSVPGYVIEDATYDDGIKNILYVLNETSVCHPTGETIDGHLVFQNFCTPLEEKEEEMSKETVKIFAVGEHVITRPLKVDTNETEIKQIEFHEGYEIISITASTYGKVLQPISRDGCIIYRNTTPVIVEAKEKDKTTEEWIFTDFGTPIEEEKVLKKTNKE